MAFPPKKPVPPASSGASSSVSLEPAATSTPESVDPSGSGSAPSMSPASASGSDSVDPSSASDPNADSGSQGALSVWAKKRGGK